MINEGDAILLLFARHIYVSKEQWYIMTADEHHDSSIIKIVHSCLLLMAICSLIQSFTLINGLVRYCGLRGLCGMSVGVDNASPDGIHLHLWNEILWVIERQAVARRTPMSVMEVAIHGNVNVTTLFQ